MFGILIVVIRTLSKCFFPRILSTLKDEWSKLLFFKRPNVRPNMFDVAPQLIFGNSHKVKTLNNFQQAKLFAFYICFYLAQKQSTSTEVQGFTTCK